MDEAVDRLGKTLKFTEDEESGVVLPNTVWSGGQDDTSFYLVRRLLSNKLIRFELLQNMLMTIMNPVKGMAVKCIAENRFLFRFNQILDKNRALAACPWSIDRNMLLLSEVNEDKCPLAVDLSWCLFYVLIHDLLIRKMTKDIAELVGNRMGRSRDCELRYEPDFVDPGDDTPYGAWLRETPVLRGPNPHTSIQKGAAIFSPSPTGNQDGNYGNLGVESNHGPTNATEHGGNPILNFETNPHQQAEDGEDLDPMSHPNQTLPVIHLNSPSHTHPCQPTHTTQKYAPNSLARTTLHANITSHINLLSSQPDPQVTPNESFHPIADTQTVVPDSLNPLLNHHLPSQAPHLPFPMQTDLFVADLDENIPYHITPNELGLQDIPLSLLPI
ncbi:hypothetical protein Salat_1881700 [Sesamum alatum]|uniref:DUF4283 domain-containing protein n=1 Tax=Sesamum alatum TaxID=300844 RepID=A0AAE2CI26_9LAMI|nr:hypothetical protein Salat_1881700 [Sesamum alatum]